MRKIYYVAVVMCLASSLLTGCGDRNKVEESHQILEDKNNALEQEVENLKKQVADLTEKVNEQAQGNGLVEDKVTSVYVREYGTQMPSGDEANTLQVKGFGVGEYMELTVTGTITKLRSEALGTYDNGKKEESYKQGDIKVLAEEVKDQKVIIETIFPCGMPLEKISWDDEKGGGSITPAYDGKNGLNTEGYYK